MIFATLIVAIDEKNGIGLNGDIPWENKTDLKFFKDITTSSHLPILIAGRVTSDSLDNKCLPNRHLVTISKTFGEDAPFIIGEEGEGEEKHVVVKDESFLNSKLLNFFTSDKEVYIIGGSSIYNKILESGKLGDLILSEAYVTRIPGDHGCDTFFDIDKLDEMSESKRVLSVEGKDGSIKVTHYDVIGATK